MRTQPLTTLVSTLAVASLIAGCGGGDDRRAEPAAATATGSVEEQLGFSQVGEPAAQTKAEETIAACMRREGFQYTPVDPVARLAALTGKSGISDEEFDEQFGYGIATLYGRGTPQSDPNAAIRQRLTPADRRAYDAALTGGQPGQTFFRAADTGDFSQLGGCTKRAADALLGGSQLLDVLQRKLDELDEAVLEDQRTVRAFEAWRGCMRRATGERFEDSEDVELNVQRQLETVVGPLPSGESAPGEFAALTPEGPYDRAALARLQRLELEYATADVTCEEEHVEPVEEVVQKDKERQFREDNAELLRRVKPGG